ncbi:hypothetical protein [Streptomyces flavofungini]|uniref:hypothetical protein n=1 Tax=Streptomyces flavofungini TaxID=68200 RepID=UPI0025B1A9A3|nr:hypothetical protein [Streptomyces flavofungini]WJV47087.1 hypothetical protein QUY26_17105 [Streptomyces flavofungini]
MHTRVRSMTIGAAVASVAAALVLTGCSSDGDDKADGDKGKDKGASDSASKTPGDSGSDSGADGEDVSGEDLEGSWVATTGGKPVALVISKSRATLVGEHVCNGFAAVGGERTVKLKCADGDMDRTKGTIDSVDGKTLKITWEGFGKDEFLRTKGGKLPEGLPTADIPQS